MKIKFIVSLSALLLSSLVFAQVNFSHIAPSSSGKAEHVSKFGVSDTSLDFLSLTNGTTYNGQFVPLFYARRAVDNRLVIGFNASISTARDNGSTPMMLFITEKDDTVYPNAPTGATFPWGNAQDGLSYPISIRPLFAWNNSSTRIMTISAQNNLGLGTASPTARLHTNGTVRFENIPTTTSNSYVLTTDSSGNVRRQLSSAFTGLGATFSDSKYKEDIVNVTGALESIMKLNGKSYSWKKEIETKKGISFTDKKQYGLIANEVEKIIPALTSIDEEGDYGINYLGLIPILIEAIKEQQNQIVSLQNQININFQKQNVDLINLKNTKIINISPNPSSDIIEVSLNIEDTVKDAKLITYDLNGKIMSSLNINDRNYNIKKSIHKDNFASGTYIISLFVNGKSIDSKKISIK
ncbi:tail fiber domain-containing protein [Flavivirga jejuensis]|uniref:Tail fiber domain-containing protein n=1 Tax=Flavivirga jejuensis TaxID=870487 RepID=A0ABT8WJA9_9FLAO|nr:tail fiber domain-containing protein [Flavivirga jejuensis]MDO5973244.1 tail fiber domain-containing protein [Flavivirga jejuensis]